MKVMLHSLVTLAFFFVGPLSVSAQKTRPVSANGKPLAFQVTRVSVTQEPQSSEQMQILLAGDLGQALGTGTYRGPLQTSYNYKPIPLSPSDSFVIVSFNISNVKHHLELTSGDVKLLDGKGAIHLRLGFRSFTKPNAWSSMDEILDPKKQNDSTWIFQVPTAAVSGASIQFQSATYPLSIANQ
jgi:hypothetical protein